MTKDEIKNKTQIIVNKFEDQHQIVEININLACFNVLTHGFLYLANYKENQ